MTDAAAPAAGTPAAPAAGTPEANGAPVDASLNLGGAPEEAAPGVEPTVVEPTGPATIEFNPTGDASLDMALGFFGKLGLGPGDAAFDAAANGDFGMLKAKLGAMGAKAAGFEGFVALAEQSYGKAAEANKAKVAKDTAMVHQAVGGEAKWAEIKAWAATNAEPAEKAEVNAALKQGGLVAKAMASWLAGQHAKAAGVTVEPAEVGDPAAAGGRYNPSAGSGALSAKQYATEVQAARARMGYAFEGSREYESLQARRMAGKNAGI